MRWGLPLLFLGIGLCNPGRFNLIRNYWKQRSDLLELIRPRPDIGLHIYRNLAFAAGEKLKRLDVSLTGVDSRALSGMASSRK